LLYSVTLPLHVPSTPATYTLSLHDALPISRVELVGQRLARRDAEAERGGVEATLGLLDGEHRRVEGRDAEEERRPVARDLLEHRDRKSTRLNSSHVKISYAVFCLKKKKKKK